ncbi:hypothetical protein BDA96_10G170900 [Sorghum bicolor]|uniref:Uncharacterized protein n=2 Tax=Sorghum bicolor TaxID=4558 RepID=A0A921U188_SORBI|nr:hypothetical protein BDA96_10G170900 [Sorghum bicolor]OQU76356.1 hypothetical protein SORBI_3010G135250 [Sorghum bicolor]
MFHGNICWEATRHHAATTSTPAARGAVAQPSLPLAGRPMSPSIRRPPHLMELWVVLGCLARSSFGATTKARQYQIFFWSTAKTLLGSDPSHGPTSVELLQHLLVQNGVSFDKYVAPYPLEHMADILKTKAQDEEAFASESSV